jgi:rhodanese-related sulfurtransferase
MAGYMAENILDGRSVSIQYDELDEAIQRCARLIDVRTPGEFMQGHLPGAENLSLDEIRNRLEEFDKSQEIIVYCQVGLRGYYAERILRPHGFNVRNLSGGYKLASAQML